MCDMGGNTGHGGDLTAVLEGPEGFLREVTAQPRSKELTGLQVWEDKEGCSGEMEQQSEIPTEIIFQFLIIGHKSRPREIDSIRSSLCRTLHLPLRPLYFSNF